MTLASNTHNSPFVMRRNALVGSKIRKDTRHHLTLVVASDRDQAAETSDAHLAEATLHLVGAYEAILRFSNESANSSKSPTFGNACRLLCATLVAMEEFTFLKWGE